MSVAFAQWTARSARPNRGSPRAASARGVVVAAIALAHPTVDVVAVLLPVARLELVHDFDVVEPLERLVAVHRRDVEANGTAVLARHRAALHGVRHDHVGTASLIEREALGVLPVERRDAQVAPLR